MLDNLQYLINRVFENDRQVERIYLDVDGYRERQADNFLKPYLSQIIKVKLSGKPVTLEPMNAAERRIIHQFVEKENGLRTLTIGEGEKKRIVIFSAKQSEKEALSQSKKYSQRSHKHFDSAAKEKSNKPKTTTGKEKPKPHLKQPQTSNPKHQ